MFDPGRILKLCERAFVVVCVAFIALVVGWALFKNFGCTVERFVLIEYHTHQPPATMIDVPAPTPDVEVTIP